MKKYILTLVTIAFVTALQAQFTLSPSTKHVYGPSSEFELIGKSYVKNTGATNKTFVWRMTVGTTPNGWTAALCDKNLCWDVTVTRATFELAPGDSGNLDVHLYPASKGGTGDVDMYVFEEGDSVNGKTAAFSFDAWTLSNGKVANKNNSMEIYPNPATTKLNISLETTKPVSIEVYNVLGQVKMTHVHNGGTSTLDLSELPAGIYFVRYTNSNNQIVSKQFKKIQ